MSMAFLSLLEAAGLERLGRVLADDQVVVPEQVVDVDALGRQELVVVAGCGSRASGSRSSCRRRRAPFSRSCSVVEHRGERLGLDLGEIDLSTTMRRPSLTKSESALFSAPMRTWRGGRYAQSRGFGRVSLTAADEVRRADRAVTRAARALLLVELLGRAADRRALLGGLPCRRAARRAAP